MNGSTAPRTRGRPAFVRHVEVLVAREPVRPVSGRPTWPSLLASRSFTPKYNCVMRPTVRELYAAELRAALDSLASIKTRLYEHVGRTEAQQSLVQWQRDTAETVKRFSGKEDATRFLGHYDFETGEMSGEYLVVGVGAYEALLFQVIARLPESDVVFGYSDDLRLRLERLDELTERLRDLFNRSRVSGEINPHTAEVGLRRWKDTAHMVLTEMLGEDEAGDFYSRRAGSSWGDQDGSLEEQFTMYFVYIRDLKEEIQKYPSHLLPPPAPPSANPKTIHNDKIFIVHGHGEVKDAVARLISALKLEPVILQEKPGGGHTLIEKVEKYSAVGYAVVLVVPDDVGGKKGEKANDRARQNVIFELGYFVGKLGRGRVCMLYVEGVEIPSDYSGVEYVVVDSKDAWRLRLAQELREAGYTVDLNAL
jgi:predicted nucleotide-binding protein